MGNWQVFYADWQRERCGEPFAVGDEVSRLLLRCPKWFGEGQPGVLVDLEVSGAAPPEPRDRP